MTETERDKLLLALAEVNRGVILLPLDLTPDIWDNLNVKWQVARTLMAKLLGEVVVEPEAELVDLKATECQGGVMEHPGKECMSVHKGLTHEKWSTLAKAMSGGFDDGRERKRE